MLTSTPSIATGGSNPPLRQMSVNDVLTEAVERFSLRPAVISVWQNKILSFQDLDKLSKNVAASLLASGIVEGDRIGIWSANRYEWVVVQFAVAKIGAILVNINPAYRLTELGYVIEHSECKALFLHPNYRNFDCLGVAQKINQNSKCLKTLFVFGDEKYPGAISWNELLEIPVKTSHQDIEALSAACKPNQLVSIQYTSGTTGDPKGATLTNFNLVNNAIQISSRLQISFSDKVCLPVPMCQCFGMVIGVLGAFSMGAAAVFPAETFDPKSCLDAVQSQGCTAIYGVPMMFIAMLNLPEFNSYELKTLRTGLMGGAPCPAEILRSVIDKMNMKEMSVVYGMTETSPISLQTTLHDTFEQRVETVGSPLPHVQVKIVHPISGATVPLGVTGELCVKGYLVMPGYWQNEKATKNAIDADDWMHTGDLAVMRPDSCVAIVGRLKDVVIRAGENIFPREIEEFLHTIPEIAEAQVFGIPDELYGEQLCAWIRLKHGAMLDADSLRAKCKGSIASYKIPSIVRVVEDYPTTASGKVQKFRMREIEIDGSSRI